MFYRRCSSRHLTELSFIPQIIAWVIYTLRSHKISDLQYKESGTEYSDYIPSAQGIYWQESLRASSAGPSLLHFTGMKNKEHFRRPTKCSC